MKYKTKNIFDDMEDANSYIEIDSVNDSNQAKIVESPTVLEEKSKEDSADLTITSAMDKYFYPKFDELTNYEKRIKDVYKKINSSMPDMPKRKHVALRIILETLLSLGLGCACCFAYSTFVNALTINMACIIGGVSTIVLGSLVGLTDSIAYKRRVRRKNDSAIALNNELVGIIVEDKKHIDSFVKYVNQYKSLVDITKQVAIDDMSKIQNSVAKFNQEIYCAIERVYDITQNQNLLELVQRYKDIDNCYKDMNQILEDFNKLKKILPTLQVYAPQIIDMDNTNVIYSFRDDEAKLLLKTMIPFAQVLTVTYDKVYENYRDEQRREEEKLLQEKMRQKEEERKRQEREQEEERLRKEIEQKEFEKENNRYKKFFDNFGIEAELDQDELTK